MCGVDEHLFEKKLFLVESRAIRASRSGVVDNLDVTLFLETHQSVFCWWF